MDATYVICQLLASILVKVYCSGTQFIPREAGFKTSILLSGSRYIILWSRYAHRGALPAEHGGAGGAGR